MSQPMVKQSWGQWTLITLGVVGAFFFLVVPLIYIFAQAFQKGVMPVLQNLADPEMLHAIGLTVFIALPGRARCSLASTFRLPSRPW